MASLTENVIFTFINTGTAVPVSEAAKDFLGLLDWVESRHQSAVLTREGKPVATLNPFPSLPLTGAELAERWPSLDKLSPDEASAFADDIESARKPLPPLKAAWD